MKQIYASEGTFKLNVMKQFLEYHDIPSFIKGEHLQGAYSGMQFSWVELMVLDEDWQRARELIDKQDFSD